MNASTVKFSVAPERTGDQRMDALAKANLHRGLRKRMKRDLKAGRLAPLQLLAEPPEWLDTMKVFDWLLTLPKIGRSKANRLLQTCRISPSKTVGGLSDRQRRELLMALRGRA